MSTSERRTCDIVMKGGITSGVVYPRAITRLSGRYTFVNIGGTSAGAIAAAIAAAAEYRRHETGSDAGFHCLGELPDLLGEKPGLGSRTRLFYFFQPNARTRRLFDVITGMLGGGTEALKATLRRMEEEYAMWTIAGMLPGLLLGLASFFFASGVMVAVWVALSVALLFAGGAVGAVAGFVTELIRELPRNGYGLCSGVVEPLRRWEAGPPGGAKALSVWLADYLDKTAGRAQGSPPLTFGDLWSNGNESDPEKKARRTNLEMMTTNLSHGRPYRLPFRDDEDLHENHLFYFREDEFLRYFPERVVQWMIAHPRACTSSEDRIERRARLAEAGYRPLPAPGDLPVVVATRMSLSFPILLSAVPLHAFVEEGKHDGRLPARCWFSDGGLCSNFPLHFFDAPLPRRPTFSIDLIDRAGDPEVDDFSPEMDEDNGLLSDRWNRFDADGASSAGWCARFMADQKRLRGFFGAMISTMQNWTDATQARLPGYRDRIVRVPLSPREGGLNLDMPEERIDALSARGERAADVLIRHFDVPPAHKKMTWDNHRWIRMRSLFGALEKTLRDTLNGWKNPEAGDISYAEWLLALGNDPKKAPSYRMSRKQLTAALKSLEKLSEIPGLWPPDHPPSLKAPRPRPILRPRAQI